MKRKFGLVAIGDALVDILVHADEVPAGMKKGGMTLVDRQEAVAVYAQAGAGMLMSGGSAANSLSGFVSFGGKGAFIGKTADDEFGAVFRNDLQAQGISFTTLPHMGGEETGRSIILITPDGERTMNTYLGANGAFGPDDVDESLIAQADIVLLEGYLFDKPDAKAAFMKAAQAAKIAGTKVAFTLSDAECVKRHRDDFKALVDKVDILFANEREIKALTSKEDFAEAVQAIPGSCEVAVITRGAKGALIVTAAQSYTIAPVKPKKLEDTTGAGDAFAAGVLYGLSEGMNPAEAGALGAKAASATIAHVGARSPDVRFADLLNG
ncbi:MAG TPA: adenosine kinase [Alphaproteobacteria bacterium]